MPEGDTIHRIAVKLAPLVGQKLERVTTQGLARNVTGSTVTAVTAVGKHLVIDVDSGRTRRLRESENVGGQGGWVEIECRIGRVAGLLHGALIVRLPLRLHSNARAALPKVV